MPSLKSLKLRIKSIKSTRKITKAMQMVSAAKLKRAREQTEAAKSYCSKLSELVNTLVSAVEVDPLDSKLNLLFGNGKESNILLVCISSDRGLCGSFNMNVIKTVRKKLNEYEALGKKVSILCIGKKCYDVLKTKLSSKITAQFLNDAKPQNLYAFASDITSKILAKYEDGEFDLCELIYNHFNSVVSQTPEVQRLIPFVNGDNEIACKTSSSLEFEPSEKEIVHTLLPKNLAVQVFKALLDSKAGEYASRMTAMDNATRNSSEMIDSLNLVYNRTRQAHITKELIEIISGAEAV